MLGIGHEWWIGEQWSTGILVRATSGWVSGTDPSDPNEDTARSSCPRARSWRSPTT